MIKKMDKKLDKRAFTLIELLVVIAVLAILVLLATPRFLGHTKTAELRRIQNDVKVMEQEIGTVLINNNDEFNKWRYNGKNSNPLMEGNKLFEKEGPIAEGVKPTGGPYKIIPEKYKDEINTKLKGTFYANSDGKVYYEEVVDLIEDHDFIPIATAEEFNSIRKNEKRTYGEGTKWENEYIGGLDKQYIQVADIDLSEYSVEGWNPIGTDEESPFKGTYDGGNYVITNLDIKGASNDYQGLFGYADGATIFNVGLIDNTVTGGQYVGGLVGYASRSTISNSYTTGSVTGTGSYVGGLVGSASRGTKISNSYSTASVTGAGGLGGLVGEADGTIENSYAAGSVEGTGNLIGGLVGYASSSVISNSYATGSVTGYDYVGGLVGYAWRPKISNSYATGLVTGYDYVGGLVGWVYVGTTVNSYWDRQTTSQRSSDGGVGKTTDDMKKQTTYENWDFDTVWKIDEGNDYPTLR